jgi:hypothetical protein
MHIEVWLERERENRAEERLKSINQKEIAKRKKMMTGRRSTLRKSCEKES